MRQVVQDERLTLPGRGQVLEMHLCIRAETLQATAYLEARRARVAAAGVRAYAVPLIGSPAAGRRYCERLSSFGLTATMEPVG